MSLIIRNIGTHTAFNFLSQAAPNGPFTVEFLNNSNVSNSITENRQHTMTLRITVNADAPSGNHSVVLTHHFRDQNRETNRTATDTLHVRVVGAEEAAAPILEIRNLVAPGGNVNVNDTATISFDIHNTGTVAARNIRVAASPESDEIVPVQTASTQSIANLAPGESQRLTFSFSPRDGVSTRSYAIGFNVRCADTEFNQFVTLNVINPDEEAGHAPNLEIRNISAPTANIGVGETATISFYVYNTGDSAARNINIAANPENADIVPVLTANRQSIQNLAPGASQIVTFNFSPRSSAASRSYSIGFTVTHAGVEFSQFAAINVLNPESDGELANLTIRNLTAPTGSINVGGTATISFYVQNTGDAVARNIRVEAVPESVAAIVPVQTASTQTIPGLDPGASQRLTFSFSPTDAAITRSYTVGFTVTYAGESFSQFAAVNVFNPDQGEDELTGVQIPRVIISNTIINNNVTPRAGQPFEMEITFRNTSATRSVNNIRILMEEVVGAAAPGQAAPFAGFVRVNGSNTLIIDYIAARGEYTMILQFNTVTEATPGSHNMRFTFDYQDQDFVRHEATEQISIAVAQVTRLELADVSIGEWGAPMVGQPIRFSYTIINSGRVNLINVRTATEGSFDVSNGGRFIGPVNAQRTAGFDGQIIPFEPGMQQGMFIVYGEDLTGELVRLEYEFEIFVEGGFDDGMWMEGGGFDDGRFPGGDMEMFHPPGFWCDDQNEWVEAFRWCEDTHEMVQDWEFCFETGEWTYLGSGGGILGILRNVWVWGTAIGVVVVAGAVVLIIVLRKRSHKMFDADDE